jgi:ornithine carbamoyltransferase
VSSLKGRDLLTLQELSPEEIWEILKSSAELKRERAAGIGRRTLEGRGLALLFQRPSTRTRISLQLAFSELGGIPVPLDWSGLQLARGESIADTGRFFSRVFSAVAARVVSHDIIEDLAKSCTRPVFNALSDLYHPTQIIADLFTIWEKKGRLSGLNMAYVGDGNNVANSLLIGCAKMGLNVNVATPQGYEPNPLTLKWATENVEGDAAIHLVRDPKEAVKGADAVETDVWVSMGQEQEAAERARAFFPTYQVNEELLKCASPDAIVLHCQPWHLGEEIAAEVAYGPRCMAFDEAENRLHTAKALFAHIIV